jgi:chemotaxis regulatin CheY-phosphate phosphatase CheZ
MVYQLNMAITSPEHQKPAMDSFQTFFVSIFRDVCLISDPEAEALAKEMTAEVVFDAATQLGIVVEEPPTVDQAVVDQTYTQLFEPPADPQKVAAQIGVSAQALTLEWLKSMHHLLDDEQQTQIIELIANYLEELPESPDAGN